MTERSTMRQAELRSEIGFIRQQLAESGICDTARFMWEQRIKVVEAELFGDGESASMVECATCGADVRFGSCCDRCNTPTDH